MWLAVSKVRISNLGLNGALCVASKQGGTHGERWSSLHHHPCPLPHTADLASGHCKSGGIMKEGGKEGEEEGKGRNEEDSRLGKKLHTMWREMCSCRIQHHIRYTLQS